MNSKLHLDNYFVIEEFIHSDTAKDLAEIFKKDCIKNFLKPDDMVPNSPALYGYPIFTDLHFAKIHTMNQLVEEKLYPTYNYARWYKNGAELVRHTDKAACEISVTINLGGDPWPIYFTKPNGEEVSVTLTPGDAAIYRGTKSLHWRDKFTGKECVQVFLHYVTIDGPNYLHAFDMLRKNKDML